MWLAAAALVMSTWWPHLAEAAASAAAKAGMSETAQVSEITPRFPSTAAPGPAPVWGYEVVRCLPHDKEAFTQGLLIRDGVLYESTGLNGSSTVRKVRLDTGEVLQRYDVGRRYFAEGLAERNGELIQLTWETEVAFVYDLKTLKRKREFKYKGEGWGLTWDGRRFILSDGTPALRFMDGQTFKEIGRVPVTENGRPVEHLNELEMVDGLVLGNVWLTDRIAVIDPATGNVTAWLDLAGLMPPMGDSPNAVLNGIAWDGSTRHLYVTGKLWPTLFEIRPVPPGATPAKRAC